MNKQFIFYVLFPIMSCLFIKNALAETSEFYNNSYALVIGINTYAEPKFKDLSSAVFDAKSIAHFLKGQGFEIITLYNEQASRLEIISKMQNYFARKVEKNDRFLFFFAGHGFTESLSGKDYGYIVPADGSGMSASYISMEELRAHSEKLGYAKHQLFIMDCCFGGLLTTRDISDSSDIPGYLYDISRRTARQIITAGGSNQQVVDTDKGGHSTFTGTLLEALEESMADLNGDGYITFSELSSYVVPRATNDYQTPAIGVLPKHGQGEFIFTSPAGMTQQQQIARTIQPDSFRSESLPPKKQKVKPTIKASSNKPGDTYEEPVTKMQFAWVAGGCYMMGCESYSGPCESFEKPAHEVCIDGFWIAKTEVTQGQWKSIMDNNPSANDVDDHYPVELVSWNDVQSFIDILNSKTNSQQYRLPTEAEWEYACRSGGKKQKFSGGNRISSVAWYDMNSKNESHPVSKKRPNDLGLYDMSGNVQEWCSDTYSKEVYTKTIQIVLNPDHQGSENSRVIRGGGWGYNQKYSRCCARKGMPPEMKGSLLGFRLVKVD